MLSASVFLLRVQIREVDGVAVIQVQVGEVVIQESVAGGVGVVVLVLVEMVVVVVMLLLRLTTFTP